MDTNSSTTQLTISESRISLRLKTERPNLHDRNNLSITSIVQINSAANQDVSVERPTTSKPNSTELSLVYSRNDYADMDSSEEHILRNEVDFDVSEPGDESVEPRPVPPPYEPTYIRRSQVNHRAIFDPGEFEISITPPLFPPMVLYSAPPLHGAPPTYSAIMRIGPSDEQQRRGLRIFNRRPEIRIQPSPPFIAPVPPPTYAETQGCCYYQPPRPVTHPLIDYRDSNWGPESTPVMCPICNNFVITNVHVHRSQLTHFSALALCLCGCWPCCLLPYCMNSCKTSYHECPICLNIIGMHNPW